MQTVDNRIHQMPRPRLNRTNRQTVPSIAWFVATLDVLLGLGALFGGAALALGPDGHLLGMKTSLLAGSPFTDYLVPGVILFLVMGVFPLVAAAMIALRSSLAPIAAIASGLALIGWIVVEMIVLAGWGSLAWSFYMLLGATITATAFAWWRGLAGDRAERG